MAGDGMLLVNFGQLQQGVADIAKAVGKMQADLDQLQQDARPLVESWDGTAQQAYAARQAKWTAASNDLTQILQNIKQALETSAEDYVNTEKQATQRFQ
jgi:early secretory antigenic target protein ESAT-6